MQPTVEELSARLGVLETHYAESFTNTHNVVGLAAQWALIKELREQLAKIGKESENGLPVSESL